MSSGPYHGSCNFPSIQFSLSISVTYDEGRGNLDERKKADRVFYRAGEMGRNRVEEEP